MRVEGKKTRVCVKKFLCECDICFLEFVSGFFEGGGSHVVHVKHGWMEIFGLQSSQIASRRRKLRKNLFRGHRMRKMVPLMSIKSETREVFLSFSDQKHIVICLLIGPQTIMENASRSSTHILRRGRDPNDLGQ